MRIKNVYQSEQRRNFWEVYGHDNHVLLTALLDLLEDGGDNGDITVHQTNKDRIVKPMLDCLVMYHVTVTLVQ